MLTNSISSVIDCLLHGHWKQCEHGYITFIGSIGTIATVPGRPHEWYQPINLELKKHWFCCEHGIDWWFNPVRCICRGLVHYGAEVKVTRETMRTLRPF